MDGADLVALIIVVGVFMLLAGLLGFFAAMTLGQQRSHRQPDPAPDTPDSEGFEDGEEEPPALKIDPENPPTWKVYRGQAGPACTCHDRQIQYGENILMWPDPEEGGYRLFHEGFVKGMVPPGA